MLEPIARLINKYLALDPDTKERMIEIEGACARVDVLGFEQSIYVACHNSSITLSKDLSEETPTVVIRGAPLSLLRMLKTNDPTELVQSGEIEMQGDAQLGRKIKAVFDGLDIDWEELLAQRIGDIPANYIGSAARELTSWRTRSHAAINASVSEYLKEEIRQLVTPIEVENWLDEIDDIRETVDRLEARIRIVEEKHNREKPSK